MSKHKAYNNITAILKYHIILSTKYHRKVLKDLKYDLLNAIMLIQQDSGNFFNESDIVEDDHIHLFLRIKPTESIDAVVSKIKQETTYLLWKQHHTYLSKFYLSGKHYLWTTGYFASTIKEFIA